MSTTVETGQGSSQDSVQKVPDKEIAGNSLLAGLESTFGTSGHTKGEIRHADRADVTLKFEARDVVNLRVYDIEVIKSGEEIFKYPSLRSERLPSVLGQDSAARLIAEDQRLSAASELSRNSESDNKAVQNVYTLHNSRTHVDAQFTNAREAGAAFFIAERADRPAVIHSIGNNSARTMADTAISGTYENGEQRFVKSLPNSHPSDAEFRAGYMDALEESVNVRLKDASWEKARPDHPAKAPNLDERLYDDLATLARIDSSKAIKAWKDNSPEWATPPAYADPAWKAYIERSKQSDDVAESVRSPSIGVTKIDEKPATFDAHSNRETANAVNSDNARLANQQHIGMPLALPQYGAVVVDGKTATSVQYVTTPGDDGNRYDVSFKLSGTTVYREKALDIERLVSLLGERNAAQITSSEAAKGTLKGESLAYVGVVSRPVESEIAPVALSQEAIQYGEEVKQRIAQLRGRERMDQDSRLDGNAIVNVSSRNIELEKGAVVPPSPERLPSESRSGPPDAGENDAAERILALLGKRYREADGTFHFRSTNDVAFSHDDATIKSKKSDADVVRDMVALSVAKGWTDIHVKGSEDFRREAWIEGSAYGLKVTGYIPREIDQVVLLERRQDVARKEVAQPVERENQIVDVSGGKSRPVEKDNVIPFDRDTKPLPSASESPVVEELKFLMKQRGDSEAAIQLAAKTAADRLDRSSRVVVGEVQDFGKARYNFDNDEAPNFYVTLNTKSGEKTLWGRDLARAVEESDVKKGQLIALENNGKKAVSVEGNVRDEQGKVIGKETIGTYRNTWELIDLEKASPAVRNTVISEDKYYGKTPAMPESYSRQDYTQTAVQQQSVKAAVPVVDRAQREIGVERD